MGPDENVCCEGLDACGSENRCIDFSKLNDFLNSLPAKNCLTWIDINSYWVYVKYNENAVR